MKKETTSTRLKSIMDSRGLKQVDILRLTEPLCKEYGIKMNRSDISQYVSGKVEPSQEKLVILGMALDVNEAWLMGFDVPKARSILIEQPDKSNITNERRLLYYYRQLSSDGQNKVDEYIEDLVASGRYKSTDGKYKPDYIIYPGAPKVAETVVEYNASSYEPETIAAHHEGDWTKEELDEVEEFKKYVKDKNKNR